MKFTKILLDVLFVFACVVTLISVFSVKRSDFFKNFEREKQKNKSKFLAFVKAFFHAYKLPLICVLIAALAIISIELFFIIDGPPSSPSAVESVTETNPTPVPTFGEDDAWLDEIDPILSNTDAMFISEWDPFTQISVKGIEYPHSIGFCIPASEQEDYLINHDDEQINHSEMIEYLLNFKYQTLRFEYGIDDSSFADDAEYVPACEFRIVVQSCNSDESLAQNANILFDTDWMNYRIALHSSGNIDVSDVEAIRITVYWRCQVSPSKPLAFNIALVNPILYGKEN